MVTKLVCLLISSYLLLAGDYHVVSGFTQVTYSSESSSTECGQQWPSLDGSTQQDPSGARSCQDATQPSAKQILSVVDSVDCLYPSAPHNDLQATKEILISSQWLTIFIQVTYNVSSTWKGTNCGGQGGFSSMRVTNVNTSHSQNMVPVVYPQGLTLHRRTCQDNTLCGQNAIGCQGTCCFSMQQNNYLSTAAHKPVQLMHLAWQLRVDTQFVFNYLTWMSLIRLPNHWSSSSHYIWCISFSCS